VPASSDGVVTVTILSDLTTVRAAVDFTTVGSPLATLPPPSGVTATAVASGGTFTAGTYYWKVTATDGQGETTGSAEVSRPVVAGGYATIAWAAVPGATGYRVYRSTVAGGESTTPALVWSGASTSSLIDTGAATTAGAVPAVNTTRPYAGGVFTVTVTESLTGRRVRGLSRAMAPGGIAVGVDHEAPFGVAQSYVATAYNAAGTLLGTSTAAAVTVPVPAVSPTLGAPVWLKSLTTPSMSVQVTLMAAPDWTAPIAEGVLRVIGRADPIVVQDVRQYETGSIDVLTQTAAAETALKALLSSPGPYLVQIPGLGTDDRYVTVSSIARKRTVPLVGDPYRTWSLPLTQVARPSVVGSRVSVPGHTYADSIKALPTYASRTGTYSSR